MQRNISFSTINRTATGMPGAGELDTMLATGYDVKRGNFIFGPTSSLQYLYFGANSFNEGGADSLNLNVQGWNTSSMIYSLGSHVAYNYRVNKNLVVIPNISLNWQHQFLQNSYAINSTLNGASPTFANYSTAPLRDTFFPSVGFTVGLGNKWDTSFSYSASAANQNLSSQNIFWSLGMRF
jgi:outer membrane autotransporter protein